MTAVPAGSPPAGREPAGREPAGREPAGPSQLGVSGFATAALVLGFLGWFPVVLGWYPVIAVLAIVLGGVAFQQMRQRSQTGTGRAVAGIALGVVWCLYWAVDALAAATAVQDEGRLSTQVLAVGQCFDEEVPAGTPDPAATGADPADEHDDYVTARPCDGPHDAQVVAHVDLGRFFPVNPYPGEVAIEERAAAECDHLVGRTVPAQRLDRLVQSVFYPNEGLWEVNRRATCLVHDRDEQLTGSVLD